MIDAIVIGAGHNGLDGGPGLVPDTSLIVVSASTGFPVGSIPGSMKSISIV